jgi:Helicase associated domain
MLSLVGSFYQKSLCRTSQNGVSLRRQFPPPVGDLTWGNKQQVKICKPLLIHRFMFSDIALSKDNNLISEKGNHSSEPESVTSVPRRRRPLRISSVPKLNIGEQRLYSSPGSESERRWNSNVKKFRIFVQRKFQRTKGQAPPRIQPKDFPKNASLRTWLSRVRTEYNKKLRGQPSRLTEQRIEQLRHLGFQFIETVHFDTWEDMFQKLCTYLKEHDGLYPHEVDFSTLSKEDIKLYRWCIRQRVMYNLYMKQQDDKAYMNEKRIEALNSINFVWNVLESRWDEKYEELKTYYKEHGTTLVPATYISNYSLGRWVHTQRQLYTLLQKNKPSSLSDERIQLLNDLEFVWDHFEVIWMERYNELVDYQRLNGQYVMPTNASNPSLRRWVLLQRKQFHQWMNGEPSKMTARRKQLLDQLGMDWAPTPAKKSTGK